MNNTLKGAISLLAAGTLVFSLSACTNMDEDENPNTSPDTSEPEVMAPEPMVSIDELTGDNTQVTVDAGFLTALEGLGVTPGVSGTATLTDGVLQFPITDGELDYYDPEEDYRPYVQGEIDHEGSGLTLTAGDKVVNLTNFSIDPGESKLYGDVYVNDELVKEDVYLFELDGSTLMPLVTDEEAGTGVLEGTTVLISEDAAPLLNETFGVEDIKAGMVVGVAKITVNT